MEHFQLTSVQIVSMWILPILFAVTIHEVAHGYIADLLGDKTARVLGRLTLNPVKHIDIFGTIVIPILLLLLNTGIILGWAKPVPVNIHNFKNPRRDMALVALAGPMSNFIMALMWATIAKIGSVLLQQDFPGALAIYTMGGAGIAINLMLMVLNLLPIPPLDGSHIVAGVLPRMIALRYEQIAPFGFVILIVLLYIGAINTILSPIIGMLYSLIGAVFGLTL
ncbi:MAG: peptidase M50 [uncultured bacterium]|nr:MAG: peptidase M50 [uncultured bacterium]